MKLDLYSFEGANLQISGDVAYVVPPVPIPNTVVKHIEVESTWLETAWEDRKLPVNKTGPDLCQGLFLLTGRLRTPRRG